MMWPPDRVKMQSTPARLSARAASLPPCRGLESAMGGPSCARGGAQRRYHPRSRRVNHGPTAGDEPTVGRISAVVAERELRAPVVAPGRLVVSLHGGVRLAEAHGVHARGRDAEVDEIALHLLCAALAEREVVLLAAALVAVPLDHDHGPLRLAGDRLRVALEQRLRVVADLERVVVEVDGLEADRAAALPGLVLPAHVAVRQLAARAAAL